MPMKPDLARSHPSLWQDVYLKLHLIETATAGLKSDAARKDDILQRECLENIRSGEEQIRMMQDRLHCVVLDTSKFLLSVNARQEYSQAIAWCKAELGDDGERWTGYPSTYGYHALYFRHEADATAFKMAHSNGRWADFGWQHRE